MSNVKQTMSNFNRQVVIVPAYEVATVDFMGVIPNYFRVQNGGASTIYCSANNIPTKNRYDFSVSGGGLSMYAEPNTKSKLHIYNPTGSAITCTVITFAGEFDPMILALSNIEVDMPNNIETSNVIGGFSASLPVGANKIGKVDVDNWPTDYAKEAKQKDYSDVLGNIYNQLQADPDYTAKLNEILTVLGNVSGGSGGGSVSPVVTTSFGGGSADTTLTAPAGKKICEIVFFSNDSEGDMTLTHVDYEGNSTVITIKAGEVLNNVVTWANSVSIVCNGGAYRYGWTVKTV